MAVLTVFGREIQRGEKVNFRAPLAELPDSTPVSVPIMAVCGRESGPTVCLSGAIHGDEYNGVVAISRLLRQLDPATLRGTVVGVPLMNPYAYYAERRLNVFDYELQNLNRIFPGNPEGDLGQIMAHKLFEEVFVQADYLMDYHEGGRDFMAKYLIVGGGREESDAVMEKGYQMARWFGHGIPVAVTHRSEIERRPGYGGTLSGAAGAQGIPSLASELGGAGRMWEEYVSLAVAGTRNVLIGLEMVDGEMVETDREQVFSDVHEWPRPTRAGLLIPAAISELNAIVAEGDVLATVHDPFGEVVEEIKAPYPSIILDTRHSGIVYPGDWTYHCGLLP